MEKQTIRIRRVGSFTFGIILIVSGVVFLLKLFFYSLSLVTVFRFWPLILILLGVEVLLGTRQKTYQTLDESGRIAEQSKVIYDFPAIFLTMALTGFSFCMALLDWAYVHGSTHIMF